jgi:hypothetical protein
VKWRGRDDLVKYLPSKVQARVGRLEKQLQQVVQLCNHCGGCGGQGALSDMEDDPVACQSLECGIYFERTKAKHELKNMRYLSNTAFELLERGF